MRTKILALAVVVGLSMGFRMDAQPPEGGRAADPGMAPRGDLTGKLNLNAEQQKAWEAIRAEMDKSTESTRARLRELRDQGAGPDDNEVVEARETMRKAFTKAESDLMDILTDEQRAQYKELKSKTQSERGQRQRGRRGGRAGGGSGGGAP